MKKICIIGTGGFAKEILCLLTDMGKYDQVECFMEPDFLFSNLTKLSIMDKPIKPMSHFNSIKQEAIIGTGDSKIRKKVVEKQLPKDTMYSTIIHPSATISKWVEIGKGAVICAGSIITCGITIGDFAHLNLGTTIGHDCQIGDYFTTAPSTNISGECTIGDHVYFGTGSATKQGVKIGNHIIVGMGSMVTKNLEDSGVYIGIPARKIGK